MIGRQVVLVDMNGPVEDGYPLVASWAIWAGPHPIEVSLELPATANARDTKLYTFSIRTLDIIHRGDK